MVRKCLIAGNWKMNGLMQDSHERLEKLASLLSNYQAKTDILICPPFLQINHALAHAKRSNILVGAQDCHFNLKGAHTGDISPAMLEDIGCKYVILGHSERRINHNETNNLIKQKVVTALSCNLNVIVCIGEIKEEKESNNTLSVIEHQLLNSLPSTYNAHNVIIAYEPVWAIGTGVVPTLAEIKNVHTFIRSKISNSQGEEVANNIKILYGGSLNTTNCKEILAIEDVDGGLIGGASLVAEDFFKIIKSI